MVVLFHCLIHGEAKNKVDFLAHTKKSNETIFGFHFGQSQLASTRMEVVHIRQVLLHRHLNYNFMMNFQEIRMKMNNAK